MTRTATLSSTRHDGPATRAVALMRALAGLGVRRIHSVSGNQIMPLYDASLDAGVEIVHARHEGAAVFMADAAARLRRTPAVALVTAGPGFGNALGALYAARCAESPVVLLSGDSESEADAAGAFQRLDQCTAAAPFVKDTHRLRPDESAAEALERAWRLAMRWPAGPVHLALPADLLAADEPGRAHPREALDDASRGAPGDATADAASALMAGLVPAKRPLVLVGASAARMAGEDTLATIERAHGVPVHVVESPRGLRDPAAGALAGLVRVADLLVLVGQSADFSVGRLAGSSAPVWIVGVSDARTIGPGVFPGDRLSLIPDADPVHVLRVLARSGPVTPGGGRSAWFERARDALAHRVLAHDAPDLVSGLRSVAEWLTHRDDSIVVIDGGEFGQWAQAFVSARRRLVNGRSGCIGGGLPMALAASLEAPESVVVLFSGDGSIGFHLAEFETAVRSGARPIVVVGNDSAWNAERQIQLRDYGAARQVGCELSRAARYDQAAAALGALGERIEGPAGLVPALDRALASGRAACLDWRIEGAPAPIYTEQEN